MKCLAFFTFGALAACASSGSDYPVTTQGGAAGTSGGASTPTLAGRVCLVNDPRNLGTCATTGAGGLTVSIGNGTATTTDNGSFVMNTPSSGNTSRISVSGNGIIASNQALTANAQIPVIQQGLFDQMMAQNGITTTAGSGSIIATVVRGGEPVSGVTATATPSPAFGPFYDGTTPTAWTLDPTGQTGVVWFPGAATNAPVNVTFTDPATQGETTVGGVQVVDGGVTFVEGVLP
ncbi:MAG: hypothetical protein JO257_11110 [Deltaproteobacteria bacterium]|nr:hypothetical protein [Deltaproteobacteria bacterium]